MITLGTGSSKVELADEHILEPKHAFAVLRRLWST